MALSLISSPSAFVVERRRRSDARMREDRARMQRDAHDKVYNRLSALSKRVAEASDGTHAGLSRSLDGVADDIRRTVGELQDILGDCSARPDETLATQSLKAQLASVCAAQSARLGIGVECRVSNDLPEVTPSVGWDLQCIVEEAITNAVRHGVASNVRVYVTDEPGEGLTLTVADDGVGSSILSPEDARETSTGLRGMRDRVARHGGTVAIQSAGGMNVVISIPSVRLAG